MLVRNPSSLAQYTPGSVVHVKREDFNQATDAYVAVL